MPLNQPIQGKDWSGLRIWILGASGGIGAALSVALAQHGARLVLSGRRIEALQETASACLATSVGAPALVLPLDITDTAAIETALLQIKAHWGGIDLVIVNAGTYEATRAHELTPAVIDQVLGTNLLAPMRATAAILPTLIHSDSSAATKLRGIAFVSSVAGYRGLPRSLTYGPGKAGLISFAESLWQDLNPMGLNVWLINPGFVRSRLTDRNDFKMPALIEPQVAAQAIINGLERGEFEIHFPKRFTYLMKLMQLLPIGWYLRLTRRLVPPLMTDQFK